MILTTDRLILREYTWADFDDIFAILTDAETMKYYPAPYEEKHVRRWIEWNLDNYVKYGFGLFAVTDKEGTFLGDCGITMQKIDGEIKPEIGYHIDKRYWRRGFASEAAACCRDFFFKNTEFDEVFSYMTSLNVPSAKVAQKIGMTFRKQYYDPIGGVHKVYSLTRSEWLASENISLTEQTSRKG